MFKWIIGGVVSIAILGGGGYAAFKWWRVSAIEDSDKND